jgi:hypothetical protein
VTAHWCPSWLPHNRLQFRLREYIVSELLKRPQVHRAVYLLDYSTATGGWIREGLILGWRFRYASRGFDDRR